MSFKQGDIVYIDLDPTKGHEQAGKRPCLVISNNDYNKIMGLFIFCPITNNTKNFPTHVKLDSNTITTGCVLCEHVKTLDLKARKATKKEECPQNILQEVLDIVHSCI